MSIKTYEDFKNEDTIVYGSRATSASVNHAPLILKKEINELYNQQMILTSQNPLAWDTRESYTVGDLAYINGVIYRALRTSSGSTPPSSDWEVFDRSSIGTIGGGDIAVYDLSGLNAISVKGDSTAALVTTKQGILPYDNGVTSTLGSSSRKFKEVHATTFYGQATSAQLADLAEKYQADATYDEGTVLAIGGANEVTLFKSGMPLAGVVSINPGFKLNEDLAGGIYVALKGKVPVKVSTPVKKGQYVVADDNGKGRATDCISFEQSLFLIGVALEDSVEGSVKVKV